jgi:hypothetical protein
MSSLRNPGFRHQWAVLAGLFWLAAAAHELAGWLR